MKKIFISWSGNSKIAEVLRKSLMDAFEPSDLSVFVSSESIITGDEWFSAIKRNLQDSIMTLVCLTKDNLSAPWLYFEAGASQFHNFSLEEQKSKKLLMVILFDTELPENSPLQAYNYIKWSREGFIKLFKDINNRLNHEGKSNLTSNQIERLARGSFGEINKIIKPILNDIKERHSGQRIKIYPEGQDVYIRNKIYLACPMASLSNEEQYQTVKEAVRQLRNALVSYCHIPEKKIYAPALSIASSERFDGNEKALAENFAVMKQIEYYVCLYDKNVATSMIAEIGYCIALRKNIIIFQKEGINLPYILQDSDKALPFVKIYSYKKNSDIIGILERNQKSVLDTGR